MHPKGLRLSVIIVKTLNEVYQTSVELRLSCWVIGNPANVANKSLKHVSSLLILYT